jgi:hypothetical protein
MKKFVSAILALFITVSLVSTAVFAQPAWKTGSSKSVPPGIAKKFFVDSDAVKWAQKAIEKLMSKGIVKGNNGMFLPKNQVTKLEAVIMSLRVMGWEDEALSINSLPKKYKGKNVQNWAKGYITLAEEKGILDDVDMMYFDPNEPIRRHEMAKYIIRALGYEEEAEDSMDEDLEDIFKDAAAVPVGSVGYVYLVYEMKIMVGDGQRFNPMGTLTRAEMATLFYNLDEKIDNDIDDDTYRGIIYAIDDDRIVLKDGRDLKTFSVDEDDVIVYGKNGRSDYDDLRKGLMVEVEVEDGEVIFIEVIDEKDEDNKIISQYTGFLTEKSRNEITIEIEKMRITFQVLDNVTVLFKNERGDFDELETGVDVTVTVDNKNRARKIYVHRERKEQKEKKIKGIITRELDLSGVFHIWIDEQRYELSDDADVKIEGKNADLDELVEGMEAELKLKDNVVVSIKAEDNEFEVEGEIEEILDSGRKLELEVDGEDIIYYVSDDVEITIDGDDADIDDLREGQEGVFEIINNVIVEIEIDD